MSFGEKKYICDDVKHVQVGLLTKSQVRKKWLNGTDTAK